MKLTDRRVIGITLLFALLLVAAAAFVRTPGYTDADYYFSIGRQLSQGSGFSQPFIWNYLAQPEGLPQPAHLYWMPLTSLLASIPLWLFGGGFRSAQVLFVLLAAALPGLTVLVARRLGAPPTQQLYAALLAIFPGYFLPFLVTTDAFGLYALLGMSALLALEILSRLGGMRRALLAGLLIGLCHLTRADGLLLLLPAAWAIWTAKENRGLLTLSLFVGYIAIMGPWMVRLTIVSGSPFPPGASRALWLRQYDELFSYPADFLRPSYLLAAGLPSLLAVRLQSLGSNLLSLLAVNHLVFLLPLTGAAAWRYRHSKLVQLACIYLAALAAVMSLVFPLPGSRGGFFHSSAALMPLIWALAPLGLSYWVQWIGNRRGWRVQEASRVLSWGMVAIAAAVTLYLAVSRLSPASAADAWGAVGQSYQRVGARLEQLDDPVRVVAVNNPPGYWNATGQPAVVIPNGGVEDLARVAEAFKVGWVVLEANHPQALRDWYQQPRDLDGFVFVETIDPDSGPPIHVFAYQAGKR